MKKILIAAYGTLRKGYGNSRLVDFGNNHLGTGVTVEKYAMSASGIPFVRKEPLSNITVDIWEIDEDKHLPEVDALEGHPQWYKREKVKIRLNNKVIEAWLYFCDSIGDTEITSGDYTDYRKLEVYR